MKGFTKRLWAFLMVLVLLVGLLPVVQLTAAAATVDYRYSEDGYIYNWGTRETDATFPSPKAADFYTDTYTYEQLSDLSGAAELSDIPTSELYTTLQELMVSNHPEEKWTSYDGTRTLYQYTDCQGSALLSTKISAFYTGTAVGPQWDAGATWNREHIWPNDKGLDGKDEDDIMVLRPAKSNTNSSRGKKAYGVSEGFYDPNLPSDNAYDLRGDVARVALYVFVRWGNTNLFGTEGVIESQDILLQWIQEDPVDTWELGRNDSVESITGTRNVFVDYPELAFALFEEEVPATMVTPSGEAVSANMNYSITAESNDETLGTVSVYGNVVTAFPGTGKHVESYTVSPGEGVTVEQNGNAFTVNATENCTVTVKFAVSTTADATYMEDGQIAGTVSAPIGEAFVLPEYHGELPEGIFFWGWALSDFSATQNISAVTVYKAGDTYTMPETGVAFHAIYAYEDKSEQGAWIMATDADQLYAGNKIVIAAKDYNVVAVDTITENNYFKTLAASFLDNTIAVLPEGALVLTLGGQAGAWTLADNQGQLLGAISGDKLDWNEGATTWNISGSEGALTVCDTESVSGNLQYNSQSPRFKVYTSTQKSIQLYVLDADAEAVHFATSLPPICEHNTTASVPEQAPTATETGWTAGTYCYDCDRFITGHDRLAPTGTSCTVSFVVPTDVDPVDSLLCYANGIELPTAGAPEGYEFLGWTDAPVTETSDRPAFLEAGADYLNFTDSHKVFYALYAYTRLEESGGGEPIWKLAEKESDLAAGKQVVIAAADYDMAMGATQASNNRKGVAITKKSDNTITFDDTAVAILTLEDGGAENTYVFNTGSGYLYAASSSGNQLKTSASVDANGNSNFLISLSDGVWKAVAQGDKTRNHMQYNTSSTLFACYAESNTQKPICFYVKTETADGIPVSYYATELDGNTCAHTLTALAENSKKAPTCTENGYTGDIICTDTCGEVLIYGDVIPATGHASATFVPAHTGTHVCTDTSWKAYYDCAECGKCYMTKAADAEPYDVPTAPGHDYTEDKTTCGNCGHARATLKLTTVSIRPSEAGIYYSGELTWDEDDADIISCGIAVSVENPQPVADGSDDTCQYTKGSISGMVVNIMEDTNTTQNALNARTPIYARAYVQLTDEYVYSDVVQVNLKQLVETIDSKLWANNSLSEEQMEALANMYRKFANVMESWNISNLKAYAKES